MSLVGQTLICAETGKSFVAAVDGCSVNYATDNDGNVYSDEGVNLRAVKELQDRSKPYTAYVSSDGKSITGWKGDVLGTVIWRSAVRLTRPSYTHGKYMYAYRVRDVHGALWYGRGSPGICINIRPMNG